MSKFDVDFKASVNRGSAPLNVVFNPFININMTVIQDTTDSTNKYQCDITGLAFQATDGEM